LNGFKKLIEGKEDKGKVVRVIVGANDTDILRDDDGLAKILANFLNGSVYVESSATNLRPGHLLNWSIDVRFFLLCDQEDYKVFKEKFLALEEITTVQYIDNHWIENFTEETSHPNAREYNRYCELCFEQQDADYKKYGIFKKAVPYDKDQVEGFLKTVNTCEGEVRIMFGDANGFQSYVCKKQIFTWYRNALFFLNQKAKEILVSNEDLKIEVPCDIFEGSHVAYFQENESGKKMIRFYNKLENFIDINLFVREV